MLGERDNRPWLKFSGFQNSSSVGKVCCSRRESEIKWNAPLSTWLHNAAVLNKKELRTKHVLLSDEAQLSERSVVLSDTLRIDSGSKKPPFAQSAALLSFSRSPTIHDVPETFKWRHGIYSNLPPIILWLNPIDTEETLKFLFFFKVRIFDIILFPIFKQVGFLYVSLLDISTYLFLISIFILFFYFYDIRARGRKIEIVCEREMSVFTSQSQILVTFHETLYLLWKKTTFRQVHRYQFLL